MGSLMVASKGKLRELHKPGYPSPHGTPPEDKEALGVIDEDPVAALTHRELAQVLCARAASGAARV